MRLRVFRLSFVFALSLAGSSILVGCQSQNNPGAGGANPRKPALGSESYLVRLKPGEDLARLQELGVDTATARNVHGDLWQVYFPRSNAQRLYRTVADSQSVAYVHLDHELQAYGVPNDPRYREQWAHEVVESAEAWNITTGSDEVLVGVIDTGVDYNHPDLRENMWVNEREIAGNRRDDDGNGLVDDVHGYDFANNDGDPMADDSPTFHGTHVAGTIGAVANNGQGVTGHAHRVKILACKFLRGDGRGRTSDAVRCIQYCIQQGVKIMNNSWGGGQGDPSLESAIADAERAGILFVAAAGNGGPDQRGDDNDRVPNFPSNYRSNAVLAVAATGRSDRLTSFSNYGATSVDVAAPGEQILSTQNNGRYGNLSGTSMATPLVSGIATLIYALRPNWSVEQVKNVLINSSDEVSALRGRVVSNGRVNALKAVQAAQSGDPGPGPGPNPDPDPDPVDPVDPPPAPGGSARPLLIGGTTQFRSSNPWLQVPLDFDVSEFARTAGVYIEVSRNQASFSNPNGNRPDPNQQTSTLAAGPRGRVMMTPGAALPGWGVYQFRVIPLDQQRRPTGRFSDASVFQILPQQFRFGFGLGAFPF
jgi:subtilisin family serine protease